MITFLWISIGLAFCTFFLGVLGIVAIWIILKRGISIDIKLEHDRLKLPENRTQTTYRANIEPKMAGKETPEGKYDLKGRIHKNPRWTGEPCVITDRDELRFAEMARKQAEITELESEMKAEREYEKEIDEEEAQA